MRQFKDKLFAVFLLGYIFIMPSPMKDVPMPGDLLAPLLALWNRWLGVQLLGLSPAQEYHIFSDSPGTFISVLSLLVFALLIAGMWTLISKKTPGPALVYWTQAAARYFLAWQMLLYGLSKVFKWQFYLPEPNLLFTPLGYLDKDILYWSVMGVSRPYVLFLGLAELLVATLLLWRRSTAAGAAIGIGVLLNIVAINWCFDISVKVHSAMLLLFGIFIILPYLSRIYIAFFSTAALPALVFWAPDWSLNRKTYAAVKALCITAMLGMSLWPYVQSGNFNDDRAARPILHGAYTVKAQILNGDTLDLNIQDQSVIQRVFMHRFGYFITQLAHNSTMLDYELSSISGNTFHLTDPRQANKPSSLRFYQTDETHYQLEWMNGVDTTWLELEKITLGTLSLMQ